MSAPARVTGSDVVLVKLRPSAQRAARPSRVELEPLHRSSGPAAEFGLDETPRWYLAHAIEAAESPWDQAHGRVARQLGVAAEDLLFVEPDLVHSVFVAPDEIGGRDADRRAVGGDCTPRPQDGRNRKAKGPDEFAWHLGRRYSDLGRAREAVSFAAPRTRIAHIDTGYYPSHETAPRHALPSLERNFVARDFDPSSASDPDNWRLLLDNSGHGTGTLSILAGGAVSAHDDFVMGGAPEAEVVPIRVSDSVVLLRTSSLARGLRYAGESGCAVATLSMGGVPTRAWGDAVDEAYELGLCLVAAAGNHVGNLPPRKLVYPARYQRVIAVCGVMADGRPYKDLGGRALEGCFGPKSAMRFALAAYTPNIPWARFGCPEAVRLNGEGTSSATPQVAAAAALWIEKYKDLLPSDWRRVEAVRHALFTSAKTKAKTRYFGQGILQAHRALSVRPDLTRPKSARSDSSFGFLRVLTGLGLDGRTTREEMFNLELAQRWLLSETLQEIVPDPEVARDLPRARLAQFAEAVIEDPAASRALRRHLLKRYAVLTGRRPPRGPEVESLRPEPPPVAVARPEIPTPAHRRIRVYATDPGLSAAFETAAVGEVTLRVRWENLRKGPVGEYLAVEDTGPRRYEGVNLNHRSLLAQDGWTPSEGNPQFHQQMVYAVAMKTIEHFEGALGRPILWRPRPRPDDPNDDSEFVRRLTVHPHALEEANAYYSPQQIALLFGYFEPSEARGRARNAPVYTCLSHDIIVHETTHAILDGMHRRFNEPSNFDVLAFHEGFADLVALLQHFTIPELLEYEIGRTRGDLEAETLLGKLAVQFGRGIGSREGLRSAIGTVRDGEWERSTPDPGALDRQTTPHGRGGVLVAAVFDALLAIYRRRIADLLRIATGGTGVLPSGAIHPDLVKRLAAEASKAAGHVLGMCVRALDYLPPVDVTFFDFLRALITADFEIVPDDRRDYRVAFVEAFSRRGIRPGEHDEHSDAAAALSVDTLRWPGFDRSRIAAEERDEILGHYGRMVEQLKEYADRCLYLGDREELFQETRRQRIVLHARLQKAFAAAPGFARSLGLDAERGFEVHSLRRALRFRLDGRAMPQVFVSVTQSETVAAEPDRGVPRHTLRGGATLVLDLAEPDEPRYLIGKQLRNFRRRRAVAEFHRQVQADPLRRLFFAAHRLEPFAALHDLAEHDRS